MKRIYIAGCGGMLGEAFQRFFGADHVLRCTDIEVNAPWLSFLDVRQREAYRQDVLDFQPDWLFHLAAMTDLEACERDPENAWRTNTEASDTAARLASELGIPILYIGTAGVFSGDKRRYSEDDEPAPLSVYGKSKWEGECAVRAGAPEFLICRSGWMMGGGFRKDKKFVQKIMRQLNSGQRELHVVDDRWGSPTYTYDFVRNVRRLIECGRRGLYHMANAGEASRLEVAEEIVSRTGRRRTVNIVPVSSGYYRDAYFARRPQSECLSNTRLESENLSCMRPWRDALAEYLADPTAWSTD